jgi:hypothetical protein
MRKCAEFKSVSREDGKTHKRCARYENVSEDILVKDNGNHNMGLVVPEPLSGLADIRADEFAWPAFGAGAAGLGALIARKWGYQLHAKIPEFAGLVGAAIGVLASIPLYWAKGQAAMTQAAVSSVLVGLSIYGLPKVEEMLFSAPAAAPTGLLTAAQVGSIPSVSDSGVMPSSVRHQADTGAYGPVV